MNSKLAHGGVIEFSLNTMDEENAQILPGCLKSLRLRSISYMAHHIPLQDAIDVFTNLHCGITDLHLSFKGVFELFFPKRALSAGSGAEMGILSNNEDKNHGFATSEFDIDWNKALPSLENLKFYPAENDFSFDKSQLGPQNFARLPRSLRSLRIDYWTDVDLRGITFENFPQSVTELSLFRSAITPTNLIDLNANAPNIRNLHGFSLDEDAQELLFEKFGSIFPSLESLIHGSPTPGHCLPIVIAALRMKCWPSVVSVIRLSYRSVPDGVYFQDLPPLPPSIDYVTINPRSVESLLISPAESPFSNVQSMFIAQTEIDARVLSGGLFSSRLQRLQVWKINFKGIEFNMWPQSLAELEISFQTSTLYGAFHKLPRSLKRLKVKISIDNKERHAYWNTDAWQIDGGEDIEIENFNSSDVTRYEYEAPSKDVSTLSGDDLNDFTHITDRLKTCQCLWDVLKVLRGSSVARLDALGIGVPPRVRFEMLLLERLRKKGRDMLAIEEQNWKEILEKQKSSLAFSEDNLASIQRGEHLGLPLNLQFIELERILPRYHATHGFTLPPKVQRAELFTSFARDILEFAPKSLTTLSLNGLAENADENAFWEGVIDEPTKSSLLAPPSLTWLSIDSPRLFPKSIFACLPKSLLEIRNTCLISGAQGWDISLEKDGAEGRGDPEMNGFVPEPIPDYQFHPFMKTLSTKFVRKWW